MKVILRIATAAIALAAAAPLHAEDPTGRARRRTPIVEVFENNRDAVVNISTTRVERYRPMGLNSPFDDIFGPSRPSLTEINSVGSGFIIHESGFVVTNAHVVGRTTDVKVIFADKHSEPATVVSIDPEHDLAVLKIDHPTPLPHLRLGRSNDIMVGETVIAIGNPLGLQHSVTSGIVSALDRELRFNREVAYSGLIQTDAAINQGNSGGPLLNINGELIGINTAIRGDAQNVGFAIPVDRLWDLLPSMLDVEKRQRVRFGLVVSAPDASITAVRANSPAEKAKLQTGDKLVRFNNQPIRDGIDYYVHLLGVKPGDTVSLAVDRRGQQVSAKLPLEVIPTPDGNKLAGKLLGVQFGAIPDVIRRRFNLPKDIGLIVTGVARNSAAATARLEEGDLVLSVNRVPVGNGGDVGLALEGVEAGDYVMLGGIRPDDSDPFKWDVTLQAGR